MGYSWLLCIIGDIFCSVVSPIEDISNDVVSRYTFFFCELKLKSL